LFEETFVSYFYFNQTVSLLYGKCFCLRVFQFDNLGRTTHGLLGKSGGVVAEHQTSKREVTGSNLGHVTSASARISKGQGYQGFLRKRAGSSFGQKRAIYIVQGKLEKRDRISLLLGSI
jgi:hypothetical protein